MLIGAYFGWRIVVKKRTAVTRLREVIRLMARGVVEGQQLRGRVMKLDLIICCFPVFSLFFLIFCDSTIFSFICVTFPLFLLIFPLFSFFPVFSLFSRYSSLFSHIPVFSIFSRHSSLFSSIFVVFIIYPRFLMLPFFILLLFCVIFRYFRYFSRIRYFPVYSRTFFLFSAPFSLSLHILVIFLIFSVIKL